MPEIEEDDFLIENQDLIGAISSSLARGETLKDSMLALYNSGYEKTKIEEAAKSYIALSKNSEKSKESQLRISSAPLKKETLKEKPKKVNILDQALAARTISPTVTTGGFSSSSNVQHVSKYDFKQKQRPKNRVHDNSNLITFLLIFILISLLLILGAVFLFKEELVNFFNRLFA